MPLQNRVTPFGAIIADPARGDWMGNRGCIHADDGRLRARTWTTRRWITCQCSFKGRQVALRAPGIYTPLFFLDETTAFAAGHRPCAECRREAFNRFQATWQQAHGGNKPLADEIDRVLHDERLDATNNQRHHQATLDDLPTGVLVARDGDAYLVHDDALLHWSPAGYTDVQARPHTEQITVLTPPSIVRIFAVGYRPQLHRSALPVK